MTSMSGFLPYNGSFNSSSLLIDDFGRIAVKPNGYPFIRWTPSAPNASQGMYSAFNGTPANPVSWLRSMNSYGQLFGAFQIGNTQQYGIWTPASPNGGTGALQSLSYEDDRANEYGQFLISPAEAASLFTPSAPNTNTGSLMRLRCTSITDGRHRYQ